MRLRFRSFNWMGGTRRKASVFLLSLLLVLVAAVAATAWIAYITESQRAAGRDRARVEAFYAAEAGIDHVLNFFNHPGAPSQMPDYLGTVTASYTASSSPYPTPVDDNGMPVTAYDTTTYSYSLFEPYVLSVRVSENTGDPVTNTYGDPMPDRVTFLQDSNDAHSSKIPTCSLDVPEGLIMRDQNGAKQAWVTELYLINPKDFTAYGDAAPDSDDEVVCKVVAVATATELKGDEVKVESVVRINPAFLLSSPGAILSQNSANFDGQFNVNWGDVWAEDNLPLFNGWANTGQGHLPTPSEDPWVNVRSNGLLTNDQGTLYANGDEDNGFGTTAAEGDANYESPYSSTTGSQTGKYSEYTNLVQHDNLVFPEYPYDELKTSFQTGGLRYYFTDEAGILYGVETEEGDDYGQLVGKEFEEWFDFPLQNSTSIEDYEKYWNTNEMLVFIDSNPVNDAGEPAPKVDGIPVINQEYYPRDPSFFHSNGYSLPTISISGNNVHTRGVFFVCANLDYSGAGNPPNYDKIKEVITAEDGTQSLKDYVVDPAGINPIEGDYLRNREALKIFHNGLLYVWGTYEDSGQGVVYGSVHTVNGFAGSGSREVWYNYRLKDGTWLNPGFGRVMRSEWAVRSNPVPKELL